MLRLAWICWIALSVGLFTWTASAMLAPRVEPKAAAVDIAKEVNTQMERIEALKTLGYGDPNWMPSRTPSGEVEEGPNRTSVQSKRPEQLDDGLITQDVAATKPDGTVIEFRAHVLFDRRSWKKASYKLFEGESPQGISTNKALKLPELKRHLAKSINAYCVGLASTEYDVSAVSDNTVLSDDRAIMLCTTLVELGYIDTKRQRAIAIGLGEKLPETGSEITPSAQRAAIIIGVTKVGEGDVEADIADAILSGVMVNKVKLDSYHRSDGNLYMMYEVASGQFQKSNSDFYKENGKFIHQRVLRPAEDQ